MDDERGMSFWNTETIPYRGSPRLRNVTCHIHKNKRSLNKMRQQRNMIQMKNKTSGEQLSEAEMGSLPKKEFKIMTVKMIQELRKRKDAQREKFLTKS